MLTVTKKILNYPALHRTGIISGYLAIPLLYIYSRNSFYPGRLWRRLDWVFLLPVAIYLIDYMPFFLLSDDKKIAIMLESLKTFDRIIMADEGWMGFAGLYFPLAYVLIAVIMYFQFRLIILNRKVDSGFNSRHNRRLFNFIVIISLLYVPTFIPGIFGILFKLSWFNENFIELSFGLSLSAVSVYLFISPDILYGFLPEKKFSVPVAEHLNISTQQNPILAAVPIEEKLMPESIQNTNIEIATSPTTESEEEIAAELKIVLEHMKEQQPFLQQGFTIQDLSNQTSIPVYQLSPLINGQFKMSFTNWVNRYRIEYFIEQVPDNPQLTMEALSKKAGFISRSTFINAFKKEKDTTPREYFKERKLPA